jgi:hypothetical protein
VIANSRQIPERNYGICLELAISRMVKASSRQITATVNDPPGAAFRA